MTVTAASDNRIAIKSIIAVDGIDGSGKSTFARNLRDALAGEGCSAAIVSVDDFRRPTQWDALAIPEVDAYYDSYYDLELAERCLRAFLAGEARVAIPRYDSVSERIEGTRQLAFERAQVAIVEGVFPLRLPSVAAGLLVFLDTSVEEARRRIIARDRHKGRSRVETERRIDRRYFPAQQRYHAALSPRDRADVVIDNERPATRRVVRCDVGRAPAELRGVLERVLR
jgi:uridine kinase